MGLESLTVRRKIEYPKRAKNLSSVAEGYNTADIVSVVPSVCYKDGISDGLVNSKVRIRGGQYKGDIDLWVTQTVAEVIALDD